MAPPEPVAEPPAPTVYSGAAVSEHIVLEKRKNAGIAQLGYHTCPCHHWAVS